ncbi:MAG: hypothetical protein ABR531_04410 [Bacteroidales bacterium]
MALLRTLSRGAAAAASSYKLIMLMWVVTLVMILFVSVPLKSFLVNIFGNSMTVERFADGFDLGLAGDLGKPFVNLMSAASLGGLLLLVGGFFLYTFFAGGLFASYATAWGGLKANAFIRESARNFLPFLKIAILMLLITGAWTFIVIGIPIIVTMVVSKGSPPGSNIFYLFYALWLLGLPVWLFVADASRRYVAATGSGKVFRALGAGFRTLAERFWLSYGIVLVILVLNIIFIFLSLWFTAWSVPSKGWMIFLFFLATQALFIIRLLMKAWRYASVCEKVAIPERGSNKK